MSRIVTVTRHTIPTDGWYSVYAHSGTHLACRVRCRSQPPDAVGILGTRHVWDRLPGLRILPTFGLPAHDVTALYQEDYEDDE